MQALPGKGDNASQRTACSSSGHPGALGTPLRGLCVVAHAERGALRISRHGDAPSTPGQKRNETLRPMITMREGGRVGVWRADVVASHGTCRSAYRFP